MLGHKKKRKETKEIKEEETNLENSANSKKIDLEKETEYIEKDLKTKDKCKKSGQNFLMKLYQILETPELSHIIKWGENGNFFMVKNITEFTEKVLPKFFKHNNFASFVRQVIFKIKF